jgi:signal transduction histidine kinase
MTASGRVLAIIKNYALFGGAQGDEKAKEQFDRISAQSAQAIDEVKEIAYNLRPYLLDRLGLTLAIRSMLNKVARSSGIHFSDEIDQLDGLLSKEEEINLYRIIQESVNNIVKHASASEAKVIIKRDDHGVDITIQDNGRGFYPKDTDAHEQQKRGFGLIGISERARLLGGRLVIESSPGQGTRISINIPSSQMGRTGERGKGDSEWQTVELQITGIPLLPLTLSPLLELPS